MYVFCNKICNAVDPDAWRSAFPSGARLNCGWINAPSLAISLNKKKIRQRSRPVSNVHVATIWRGLHDPAAL